jgi:hypothetical protein
MKRRGFLSALCATLVASDPDELLWRPGARLISVPSGNKLITADLWSILFQKEKNVNAFHSYASFCLMGGGNFGPHPLIKTNKDALDYARNYRKFYYPDHKYINVVSFSNSGEKHIGEIYA